MLQTFLTLWAVLGLPDSLADLFNTPVVLLCQSPQVQHCQPKALFLGAQRRGYPCLASHKVTARLQVTGRKTILYDIMHICSIVRFVVFLSDNSRSNSVLMCKLYTNHYIIHTHAEYQTCLRGVCSVGLPAQRDNQ